jgi:uncharacterized phage protein (TIGR01671 family)
MNTDRFKFRVWLKKEQCYIENDADICEITHDGELVCIDWGDGDTIPKTEYAFDDCVVEQCTGIKDQSGKLIYEGDVVDYYCPMADDHYQGVVTFDDNETTASGYYIKGKREGWQSYLDGSHCRIIGNVHEMEK